MLTAGNKSQPTKASIRLSEIKAFVEQIKELPSLPPVALKLIQATHDDEQGLAQISRIIENDQALTGKLLRMANSPQYGFPRQVKTIERASTILGSDLIRSLALSILVLELSKNEQGTFFKPIEFWRHNAACAAAAELIARRMDLARPQEAFVAGLLHDLGKLVLFLWNRREYDRVVAQAMENGSRLLAVEEEAFEIGHTQVGKLVMENWNFPENLVMGAWLHHQPFSSPEKNLLEQIPFIVKCANNLCHIHRFGQSGNRAAELDIEQLKRIMNLSDEGEQKLSSEILRRYDEVSSCFDWDGSTPELYLSAVSRANQELGQMQVELIEKNRLLLQQQLVMDSICRLQEILNFRMTAGRALESVLQLFSPLVRYKRLIGVLLDRSHSSLVVRSMQKGKGDFEKLTLPLAAEFGQFEPVSQPLNSVLLVREALQSESVQSPLAFALEEILSAPELLTLPLESENAGLGMLLVEPTPAERVISGHVDLLRKYTRMAGLALERILLIDRLEEQAEHMARIARKVEETQTRLYQVERLASVGRLAAGAAHEINNPLTTISAHAQLLLRAGEDEKIRRSLQTIIDQTVRISKIIGDLMGFARPAKPQVEPTDLKSVLDRTLSTLEHRIRVVGIEVDNQVPESLPRVLVDAKQMEQVFLNMILNAVQALNDGGTLTVRAGLQADSEFLWISIRDTGKGIPAEKLRVIFEPFYTTKTEGEGTGLGLAICHSIIEAHRGTIEVNSHPGEGTEFVIRVPGVEKEPEIPKPALPEAVSRSAAPESKPAARTSILIVDDEEELRNVLVDAFVEAGYQVDVAGDGTLGLEKLKQGIYDIAFLDLRMPGLEGIEVLKSVKKEHPHLPVVVISGLARQQDFESARRAGAYACVKKPFDINQLISIAENALLEVPEDSLDR